MGTSRLKVILAENDIRIIELSQASGVPYSTLKAICNGRRPHLDNAYAISDALGLHINKVFPDLYSYAAQQRYVRK